MFCTVHMYSILMPFHSYFAELDKIQSIKEFGGIGGGGAGLGGQRRLLSIFPHQSIVIYLVLNKREGKVILKKLYIYVDGARIDWSILTYQYFHRGIHL